MNKNMTKWEPVESIPMRLYVEELSDGYSGLKLLLKGENETDRVLQIQFTSHIAYRNTDESNRLKTLHENPLLATTWPLFVSTHDEFIEWITHENANAFDANKQYKNYIICTPNDIIEIISCDIPVVEWL